MFGSFLAVFSAPPDLRALSDVGEKGISQQQSGLITATRLTNGRRAQYLRPEGETFTNRDEIRSAQVTALTLRAKGAVRPWAVRRCRRVAETGAGGQRRQSCSPASRGCRWRRCACGRYDSATNKRCTCSGRAFFLGVSTAA